MKDKEIQENNNIQNMIKGRIAESIVEQIFVEAGFNLYRYGIEHTFPSIMGKIKTDNSDKTSMQLRRMPDFVLEKDGKVFFIEVKFRKEVFPKNYKNNNERENIINDYQNYSNVYFVVVSPDFIKCITLEDIKNDKTVTKNKSLYLLHNKDIFNENLFDEQQMKKIKEKFDYIYKNNKIIFKSILELEELEKNKDKN